MSEERFDIYITLVASTISMLVLVCFFVLLLLKYNKNMLAKQREMFQAILKAGETERTHVARDIHDSLGGLLGSTKSLILETRDSVNANDSPIIDGLNNAIELINLSITEARNASNALTPEAIKKFGLKGAINDLTKKYNSQIQVELLNECPEQLSQFVQVNIFRLLNELFNNTIKYANATLVEIEIFTTHNELILNYSDNGKGFDFEKTLHESKGLGLSNIANRISLLNGKFNFINANGSAFLFKFNLKNLSE